MAASTAQPANVAEYLSKKQLESDKDLAQEWTQLEELYNKK